MSRQLRIAALQMDATPAPVEARLARAADLLAEIASSGAQLAVLPEVFNTGYEYSEANYGLPETMDGQTVMWMKDQASRYGIHLAGTLLLRDGGHVYNALLLIAPDGRTWRYNKNYPWAWERAYFREGQGITVADTDLGKLGLMICWDYAHPELWQQYAGKIDALVMSSCPPTVDSLTVNLPDSSQTALDPRLYYAGSDMPFGAELDEHIAWLGVPAVNSAGSGTFQTKVPLPRLSLFGLVAMNPAWWHHVANAEKSSITGGYYPQTKIVQADGTVAARVTESGDRYTLAEVELADMPPQPTQPQPSFKLTAMTYFTSDWLTPTLMTFLYRAGIRRQSGEQMAPLDFTTRKWLVALAAAFGLGWLLRRR